MSPVIVLDALLLAGLLLIGVPVPLCFAAAVLFLFAMGDYGSASFLVGAGFRQMSSIILIALPLFIIAGNVMSQGGIAARLLDLVEACLGRFRSGLGVVVVLTTAVFGAISGMASSAVAAIGSVMIPRMVACGYDRGYATALVANSAVLALLIPPSAAMILYGWVSGTSITRAFLAPVAPGLLLVALFCFWNHVLTRRMPIRLPAALPARENLWRVAGRARRAALALAMPLIILGCIYGGVTTPTEAAAIAVVYAIPVSVLWYRDLGWRDLYGVLWKAGQITGLLLVLVFFAAMFARLLAMENVPQMILAAFLSVSDSPVVLLLLLNAFLLVIGMLMEDVSGILLSTPLLMPLVNELGIDPVHFAAIIGVNLGMGLITPPTAPILYFGALIGETRLSAMIGPTLVFLLLAYLPVVLLTTFVPALSLTLPRLIMG